MEGLANRFYEYVFDCFLSLSLSYCRRPVHRPKHDHRQVPNHASTATLLRRHPALRQNEHPPPSQPDLRTGLALRWKALLVCARSFNLLGHLCRPHRVPVVLASPQRLGFDHQGSGEALHRQEGRIRPYSHHRYSH